MGRLLKFFDRKAMTTTRSRCWVYDPHSGGKKIPETSKRAVEARLQAHFAKLGFSKHYRLDVRFRGALCYLDAYALVPDMAAVNSWVSDGMDVEEAKARVLSFPTKLGRLRHFDINRWSYAFFTYSHERYEATSLSADGTGLPEQGLEMGCQYLDKEAQ